MTVRVNAAVVSSFDHPPKYEPFSLPGPSGETESLVEMVGVGLHPRVRSGAAGRHYMSSGTLPMVPGVDGVGRRDDGTLVYFAAADDVIGTMSDRAVLDSRRSVELPPGTDAAAVAATMNPAMSSWVALRRRAPVTAESSVLVLGATGNAGSMAVRIAKLLGAARVVGAGRDPDRLHALRDAGADAVVQLTDDIDATSRALATEAAEVEIVLDYLWGAPAQRAITALLTSRGDRSRELNWISIGAITGATIELPSAALRSTNLRLLGAGQGSVSPAAYLAELPSLIDEIAAGRVLLRPRVVPLAEVEQIWPQPDVPGERVVLAP